MDIKSTWCMWFFRLFILHTLMCHWLRSQFAAGFHSSLSDRLLTNATVSLYIEAWATSAAMETCFYASTQCYRPQRARWATLEMKRSPRWTPAQKDISQWLWMCRSFDDDTLISAANKKWNEADIERVAQCSSSLTNEGRIPL